MTEVVSREQISTFINLQRLREDLAQTVPPDAEVIFAQRVVSVWINSTKENPLIPTSYLLLTVKESAGSVTKRVMMNQIYSLLDNIERDVIDGEVEFTKEYADLLQIASLLLSCVYNGDARVPVLKFLSVYSRSKLMYAMRAASIRISDALSTIDERPVEERIDDVGVCSVGLTSLAELWHEVETVGSVSMDGIVAACQSHMLLTADFFGTMIRMSSECLRRVILNDERDLILIASIAMTSAARTASHWDG